MVWELNDVVNWENDGFIALQTESIRYDRVWA